MSIHVQWRSELAHEGILLQYDCKKKQNWINYRSNFLNFYFLREKKSHPWRKYWKKKSVHDRLIVWTGYYLPVTMSKSIATSFKLSPNNNWLECVPIPTFRRRIFLRNPEILLQLHYYPSEVFIQIRKNKNIKTSPRTLLVN